MIPRAPFPVMHVNDISKTSLEIIVDTIVVDHTARILDFEKQVAELRKEASYIAEYVAKFEALLNKEPPP